MCFLSECLSRKLLQVVCIALASRMHAYRYLLLHAQATTYLLLVLKALERICLLELLDELHVVLQRVHLASVTFVDSRVLC